ncbi:unnamed protein product [Phyllotreta striolata]|uniref:Uncharacterized protein n=1 Tax=Phyllotreta striolata TaxID=444603 RepID=A0A9N9XIY4_PHYSR|nr:unnamed protein product [Phyllotreta striolata]
MRLRWILIFLTETVNVTTAFSVLFSIIQEYGKDHMISEFSCNGKESFNLLKLASQTYQPIRILKIDEKLLQNNVPANTIFVMNLDCNGSRAILRKSDALNLLSLPYKWVLFHSKPLGSYEKYFYDLNFSINSEINALQKYKNGSTILRKIYELKGDLQIENMGIWENNIFKSFDIERITVRRRKNLKNITLNTCIVITNNDSLNHLTDKRDPHIDSISKVNYVLIGHFKDILNVTLNFTIESTWGYKVNSSWTGMIGLLSRKKIDIGGTSLFFTEDRVDVIDYVAMITPTRSYFIFREPKLSYVTNVFILPFDMGVWLSTVALVIIAVFFLYVILNWELTKEIYLKKSNSYYASNNKPTVLDVVLISFGALCQQASHIVPASVPGRITTIVLFLSLMFLYTSYSSNIVALLQSSSSSIKNLQDLLNSRLEVGVDDTVFNRFYFPNATEPTRRALYLKKVAPPGKSDHFMPILDGVKRIREGLFAFHVESGPGYKLIGEIFHEDEKCGLHTIQFLQVIDPWLAIQKRSPYKKLIQIGFRKLMESGIQIRENTLIYHKKPVCVSRGSAFVSVGIVDCYPAVVVLVIGIGTSLFVWAIELLNKRFLVTDYIKNMLKNYLKIKESKHEDLKD